MKDQNQFLNGKEIKQLKLLLQFIQKIVIKSKDLIKYQELMNEKFKKMYINTFKANIKISVKNKLKRGL